MARAVHTDGTEPTRTRTVDRDGVVFELPYCNMCGVEMDVVRLGVLLFWKPGWKHRRKYPLKYGAFLCESCREEMGFEAHEYIAVPRAEDQDIVEALKAHIAALEAANRG